MLASRAGFVGEISGEAADGAFPQLTTCNRGLVRAQFEEIHKWCEERGYAVQAITGIPYYYRQFGYEMGLELGGGRVGFEPIMPTLKAGEREPFTLRPAEERDIPFLMKVYAHACKRSLITTHRDEAIWRYEVAHPIPVSAPTDEQIAMLFEHAYLAECNDAMAKMYGFDKAEQIVGERAGDHLTLPGGSRAAIQRQPIARAVSEKREEAVRDALAQ